MDQSGVDFPLGRLYHIVSVNSGKALVPVNQDNQKNSEITSQLSNYQKLSQLWLLQRKTINSEFSIIHFQSNLVLEEEGNKLTLQKQTATLSQVQYFCVQMVTASQNYSSSNLSANSICFKIRNKKTGKKAMYIENNLAFAESKDLLGNSKSHFLFRPVAENLTPLRHTCILVNALCGLALDIPSSSREDGEQIIQNIKNRRITQRWVMTKKMIHGITIYQISSFFNNLMIDLEGEAKKPGSRVIQWKYNGAKNQQWILENKGNGQLVIRSCHQKNLIMGIQDGLMVEGAKLLVVDFDWRWYIDGYFP